MFALALPLAVCCGLGQAFQSPTDTELSASVGTLEASFASFTGGTLLIFAFALAPIRGHLESLSSAPKWSRS